METESVERLLKLFTINELARLYDCSSSENTKLKEKLASIEECIDSSEDQILIIRKVRDIIKDGK